AHPTGECGLEGPRAQVDTLSGMPERAAHPDLDAFCEASVGDPRRAARMLAATPALARSGFAAAVVLGDAERVAHDLRQDPGLATRHDPRTGWTALHGACASRWPQLERARAGGLLAVARALLDAGADPIGRTLARPGGRTRWRPL